MISFFKNLYYKSDIFREKVHISLKYKRYLYKYIGTTACSIFNNINSEGFQEFFNDFIKKNNINCDTFHIKNIEIDDLEDKHFNVDEIPHDYQQFFEWHVNLCNVFDYLKDDGDHGGGTLYLFKESYVLLFLFSIHEKNI